MKEKSKGKQKSGPPAKPTNTNLATTTKTNNSYDLLDIDKDNEFSIQLNWCLSNLKAIIRGEYENNGKKIPERKAAEAGRVYNSLLDPKTPFIKKRQLMASYFGDYRGQMAKEEEKFRSKSSQLKISNCLADEILSKPIFCRKKEKPKHVSPSEPFKFNFTE